MRLSIAIAASVLAAAPAVAQQPAAKAGAGPSVAGYLCTFAGKCDADTVPAETREAPATKGFRLAKPMADKPAAAAPHPAALTAPRGARPAPAYGRHPAGNLTRPAVPTPVSAGQARPRADLLIGFERNSAQVSPAGLASAKIFAQSLTMPELAAKRFVIEGHTDTRGGRATNMDLSARRAQAVADLLAQQGVDRSRLVTRGLGPDVPLPGHRASDPANRRVEAELLP